MHNALGMDLGYGRYRNVGSARKFVFVTGVTALSGMLLLGVASSLIELPEESNKWSRVLAASAMFCIGLSFLMWCVDELVFTPLALGEWTVRSLIPFRWTDRYLALLHVARSYNNDKNSDSTVDEEDFSDLGGCITEQTTYQRDEGRRLCNQGSARDQTKQKTCYGGIQTGVSVIEAKFTSLTSSKKKRRETEREPLVENTGEASTSAAFQSTLFPIKERMERVQRYVTDIRRQSTSNKKGKEEEAQKLGAKNRVRLPRRLSIFSTPKTDLQVGSNSVEVHGAIRKKNVMAI